MGSERLSGRRHQHLNVIKYLPFFGDPSELPDDTPERSVLEFVDNWSKQRYGLMAEALVYFTKETKGKKAGMAKEDFGRYVPVSFVITSVEDQAAAVSHVNMELVFMKDSTQIRKQVSVRTINQDRQNNPIIRGLSEGKWKIIQNSFSDIIYAPDL